MFRENITDRKVVVLEYKELKIFEIPEGLELEDKTIVEDWCVSNDFDISKGKETFHLYIKYVGKKEAEIIDFSYEERCPNTLTASIQRANEMNILDYLVPDEEEEEEERVKCLK